jgi:predicted RNase H-like HicB family nuclease
MVVACGDRLPDDGTGTMWRSRELAMRFFTFAIVIEKEPEDEGYLAYSPSLPGCFSNGRTVEETKRNLREAIIQHVAALLVRRDA